MLPNPERPRAGRAMARSFDAIVVGLGAMGSASLRALSRRGLRVLGLDHFDPPHDRGSSHGASRIIREAYFEHPAYVPFIQRAYVAWRELEREAGRRLLLETGGIMVGPPGGVLVEGALESARAHDLPHELLDAAEMRRRFPAFHPDDAMVGVWEPRAGVLFPEQCIAAMLESARRGGAEVHGNDPVLRWKPDGAGIMVETASDRYRADRLILTAGAWIARLVPELSLPLTIERLVLFWFQPVGDASAFAPERCPITIWEHEAGRFFYAFPFLEHGVKAAIHHEGEITDIDALRREVGGEEPRALHDLLRRYMPGAAGLLLSSATCMYTNTPDGHFVVDAHPEHPQVTIVSACSGHGFKFASAMGEIVSDLAIEGRTRFDLGMFGLARLRDRGRN
jgi:sarcosine oxidase